MSAYDILMIVVLVGTTIFGAWKGMAWQLASLAALVLSYFVALRFSTQLAPVFGDHEPWNRFLAMLVIYMATSLVIWLLFRLVAGFIDRVKLKEFDRQLGAMFGLVKGVLLCVAITFFAVSLLPDQQKEVVLTSQSGFYIGRLIDKAHAVMPEEIHEVLHPYLHKIQDELDHGATGTADLPDDMAEPPSDADGAPEDWTGDGPAGRTAERIGFDRDR